MYLELQWHSTDNQDTDSTNLSEISYELNNKFNFVNTFVSHKTRRMWVESMFKYSSGDDENDFVSISRLSS